MNIKVFSSILSCILKCIRFLLVVNKKIIFAFSLLFLLNSCAQNSVALLGPAATLGSTGNAYQAGFTYGSNQAITKMTGKTAGENIVEMLQIKKNDTEFEKFLKARIIDTRKKLNLKK